MDLILDDELEEYDVVGVDQTVLGLITEEESELNSQDGFSDTLLMESIRRLYLAGKIKKRKVGNKIYYRLAENTEGENNDEGIGLEGESVDDRKNISKMARKFRSCRYKVTRGYIAPNGIGYSLLVEKKNIQYHISYVSNTDSWDSDIFLRMLENDSGIRIVTADTRTKLSVAKIFDEFVRKEYGEQNGLLSFNGSHSFRVLAIDQFFQKMSWKNLVK